MMMSDPERNMPKTVAVMMIKVPPLVIRTGFAYLRTKRRVREGARNVMKGMVESGLPPELAKKLADDYEAQLRLRTIVGSFGPRYWRG